MASSTGRILVTGATGFIGRRLVAALSEQRRLVRCLVRQPDPHLPAEVEQVRGDLLEPLTVWDAMQGVDVAYYLVHSMAGGQTDFERRDRAAAEHFAAAASRAGVGRVVYLGGLGETGDDLSHHLESRREVAELLKRGTYRTTILRAAVIIGAGGASYEMIKSLVERLPLMITPRWVSTRCQPIAVRDVIRYLTGCLDDERTAGESFDIGGPDILSYREMMEHFARICGRTNLLVPVPLLTPKLSSYWVGLVTPVKPSISRPLIEGLKNEVICKDSRIREIMPFPLTPYDEAVRLALAERRNYGT